MDASSDVAAEVRELVQRAARVAVLTGAGMSAESGVPTFRDAQTGLWARYDPMTLATPSAFVEDPELVWAWYLRRAQLIAAVQPNAGHVALARLADERDVRITTQNVDDLHERAGSHGVNHLHGSIAAFRCFDCAMPYAGRVPIPDDVPERVEPPRCEECGGLVRPGIVWFEELLPPGVVDEAIEDGMAADVLLVVGTSAHVYPAAGIPDFVRGSGTPVVEINPEPTAISDRVDLVWRASAATALPTLL